MKTRPEKGVALFYHRDSEGHSELAPPQYVEWARGEAAKLGVKFSGTPEAIRSMIAGEKSVSGDLYLDYGISGNQLSRPGFDALRERAQRDSSVSHLFVSKRDRLARPDNPIDAMQIEYDLRSAGLTIVLMGGKVLSPIARGSRLDLADLLTGMIDYDASGKFRRDLAEKLIHAKIRLANGGFSIGGEPLYGFRRWLCAEDGTRKKEIEEREIVKKPGHHVIWLPTATRELEIVNRILDLIEKTPATRIARMLNEEGVPAPKADRVRTWNGEKLKNSGLWTQNTVKNIATHPLLIAMWEYGKRSEGDQLRFTKQGPRPLSDGDYRADGKPKMVTNPADQIITTKAKSEPVITTERFKKIQSILEHRGKHLKGKARARGDSPNPLGGRIHDLNCQWPMYRYARRGKWCYCCALYHNSDAKRCNHNVVEGTPATRFVLNALKQRVLNPSASAKLRARLQELAVAEQGEDTTQRDLERLKSQQAIVERKLKRVGDNLAFAEDADERKAIRAVFHELKAEAARLEQQIAEIRPSSKLADPAREVKAALQVLDRLGQAVEPSNASFAAVGDVFRQLNTQLYLKFRKVKRGSREFSVPAGGILTFGSTPPPLPMYEGPTDRVIIRKMLAAGELDSTVPGQGAPGDSDSGQKVGWSRNVKRGTNRCT